MGKYTTSSYSLGGSTQKYAAPSSSTNIQLCERNLLNPDEVMKIKRPYQIVLSANSPAVMRSPDISEWTFNTMLGILKADRRCTGAAPDSILLLEEFRQSVNIGVFSTNIIFDTKFSVIKSAAVHYFLVQQFLCIVGFVVKLDLFAGKSRNGIRFFIGYRFIVIFFLVRFDQFAVFSVICLIFFSIPSLRTSSASHVTLILIDSHASEFAARAISSRCFTC